MSLKHITKDCFGKEHKYEGKPPLRHARITNLQIDMDTAYILYEWDKGKVKPNQIPSEVIVKWRGVSHPAPNVLKDLVHTKLRRSRYLYCKVVNATIEFHYKPKPKGRK